MDRHSDKMVARADPSALVVNLVSTDLSDLVDLPITAKAFEVCNLTAGTVSVRFSPVASDASPVVVQVPSGAVRIVAAGARRFWSTGSTGLSAGLIAGTVDVLLHLV